MEKEIKFPVGHVQLDSFMEHHVSARFPDAKVVYKSTSRLMKFIYIVSFMWIWNRAFMTAYSTVWKNRVYVIDAILMGKDWDSLYVLMRHEYIHMLQREKYGSVWFSVLYASPQVFSLLSLGALAAIWQGPAPLFFLINLAWLAPWPSPYRAQFELEGYMATMISIKEVTGSVPDWRIRTIIDNFVSSSYYYMCWRKDAITKTVLDTASKIKSNQLSGIYLTEGRKSTY